MEADGNFTSLKEFFFLLGAARENLTTAMCTV